MPPLPNNQKVAAYEVWLYNSNGDARSLGAQYTNAQGVLQGRAPLPADFAKFKAVDISRELFSDKNAGHGNNSVLRGTFASLKPVPQQQQGGATTTPGPSTRAPALGPLGQQLPGVHDPGRVEPLLHGAQRLHAQLAHLGGHPGRVVAADGVVVGDRAAVRDDRVHRGRLRRAPLVELGALLRRAIQVK